jgi:hypothetical protein
MEHEKTLPRDEFTVRLRELSDNPGAVRAQSRIDITDFYGNAETWTVDTFREDTGVETAFVQKMSVASPLRLMLPPKVMAAVTRQHDTLVTQGAMSRAPELVQTANARLDNVRRDLQFVFDVASTYGVIWAAATAGAALRALGDGHPNNHLRVVSRRGKPK